MEPLGKTRAKADIGYSGTNTRTGIIRGDEILRELKGTSGIKKLTEMRDNDATVGAIMYGTEQILRDVPRIIVPSDKDNPKSVEMAEWLETVFEDMEHTLDDHISEALSFLTYGFAVFEPVYKIRGGPSFVDPKRKSKFTDGHYGIRKLASRAQWTVEKFDVDEKSGDINGVYQLQTVGKTNLIPRNKMMLYRTTTVNNDPSGRSILRNAYKSYVFLNTMQNVEGIAVERELNGIPIVRIPSDYLAEDATEEQAAVKTMAERIGRDLKFNEQGSIILPSDVWIIDDKATTQRLVDVELIASKGTRNISIDPIITRYQHDIARSVMAEFLMLGSSSTGSYALSKSKTDIFLRSVESYINSIYDVINLQLVRPLWELNGFDIDLMPTVKAGDVAPHDLDALGSYLRNLNGADINLTNQIDIIDAILANAELPPLDKELYLQGLEEKKQAEKEKQQAKLLPQETSKERPKENGK